MKLLDFRGRDFPLNQPMEAIRMPKSYQNKEILLFVAYFKFWTGKRHKTSGRLGTIYILSWVVITQMYSHVKANQGIECSSAKHFIKSFNKK